MVKFLYIIQILLLIISVSNAQLDYLTEKPDFIIGCQIMKPNFTQCSTKSIQKLFQEIGKRGIPELNFKVDPLTLDKIRVNENNTEAVNLKVTLTKLMVRGLANLVIVESRVSRKDYSWQTKIFVPKIRLDGGYTLDGKILVLRLNGKGKMFIEIDSMPIRMLTTTRLYEKGGFTFYNVTNVRVNYTIQGLKTRFDNLFGGNKELEDSTNQFFNENWQALAEALEPVIKRVLEDVLLSILNRVFNYYPANFIVTDIPTSKELYG